MEDFVQGFLKSVFLLFLNIFYSNHAGQEKVNAVWNANSRTIFLFSIIDKSCDKMPDSNLVELLYQSSNHYYPSKVTEPSHALVGLEVVHKLRFQEEGGT
jgi:hypothetical protein